MSQGPAYLNFESKDSFIKPGRLFLVLGGDDLVIQFDFQDAVPPSERASLDRIRREPDGVKLAVELPDT